MVAAFFEFNHGGAVVAATPARVFGQLGKLAGVIVAGAFCLGVPFPVAGAADFGFASTAFAILATTIGAAAGVDENVLRLDPFSTAFDRTVDPVLCSVLSILLVPLGFELVVEELIDMLERNLLRCATSRRHMLGISQGEREQAP